LGEIKAMVEGHDAEPEKNQDEKVPEKSKEEKVPEKK
jgi:hypothetical protein